MRRRGRWSRPLHNFHRVVVFASTVGAALVTLLFQHLLGLSVCETQQQLNPVVLHGGVVKLAQNPLGDVPAFKTVDKLEISIIEVESEIKYFLTARSPPPCSRLSSHRG